MPAERRARVLVVDDQPLVARALTAQLRAMGLASLAVHDGELALAALAVSHFDLVISDVDMRPMTGLQLLAAMDTRGMHVPFMFLTGLARPDVLERARQCRFVRGVAEKPLFGAELAATVRRALVGPIGP